MKKKFTLLMALMLCASVLINEAKAQFGPSFELVFYGNYYPNPTAIFIANGRQASNLYDNNVSYYGITNLRDYLRNKANPSEGTLNDIFKSVTINAKAGAVITFYGNADGDGSAGSCVVQVKKDIVNYYLTSFERTYEDSYIKVNWWSEQTKLDGRVSSFNVY